MVPVPAEATGSRLRHIGRGRKLATRDAIVAELSYVAMIVLCGVVTWLIMTHAKHAGIQRALVLVRDGRTYGLIAGTVLVVAAGVVAAESLDPAKSSFDSNSYCVAPAPFLMTHWGIVSLSLAAAMPLTALWRFSAKEHVPTPVEQFGWGVSMYVVYLETQIFLCVAGTGIIAAAWLSTIANDPIRTSHTLSFLGAGAVLIVALIVYRLLWCGFELRRRYMDIVKLSSKWRDLPPDPTENLLGVHWWTVPAALAASFAVAYKALDFAGAIDFWKGVP